jgi:hypothetical protein
MTEDFFSRAMREYERVRPCETMKPSLEARLDWLEADASVQRLAILKMEKDNRLHRMVLWVLVVYIVTLPLVWMLNFPPPSVMP